MIADTNDESLACCHRSHLSGHMIVFIEIANKHRPCAPGYDRVLTAVFDTFHSTPRFLIWKNGFLGALVMGFVTTLIYFAFFDLILRKARWRSS